MLIQFIDKEGNIQNVDSSLYGWDNNLEKIDNVYFEKKETVKDPEAIDYKKILKDSGVKATHLLSDEKAKEKCEELGLL